MPIDWSNATEDCLEAMADEAQVKIKIYKKMHEFYSRRNTWFTLPIVIISALSGSGNFISQSFPEIEKGLIMTIGAMSIFTSIISSISQFLKLSQLSESSRIAAQYWQKFFSGIRFTLLLRRQDRPLADDFLKITIAEYDRLQENSPDIPEMFIIKLQNNMKNHKLPKDFVKPNWFNGFRHIQAYLSPNNLQKQDTIYTQGSYDTIQLEEIKIEKNTDNKEKQPLSIDTEDEKEEIQI